MIQKISFICETCAEGYHQKEEIHTCILCGQDYCKECAHSFSQSLGVCDDCYQIVETLSSFQNRSPDRFLDRLQGLLENI